MVLARHPLGRNGVLLDVGELSDAKVLAAAIRRLPSAAALCEVIPAARTVYLQGSPSTLANVLSRLDHEPTSRAELMAPRIVKIPVVYDGIDLPVVAEKLSLRVSDVIELHTQAEYEVAFFGFAPGQAFFAELPQSLRLPRRSVPRTRVPSGALAIANEFSVIYPESSPGGWHLIGTRAGPPLWIVDRDPPNAVDVGDRVRFMQVA